MDVGAVDGILAAIAAVTAFLGGRYVRRREAAAATSAELDLYEQRIEGLIVEVQRSKTETHRLGEELELVKVQVEELSKALTAQKRAHELEKHALHLFFEEEKDLIHDAHKAEMQKLVDQHTETLRKLSGGAT